ncbi:MAG: radical SAM protein [Candidatus Heimdallarchaeota archaeon]|nr:radical SAM protein [Candidatus Heimdallarchaeota archaeon]
MNILIVDALAANEGRRKFSRDAIGVGPRLLAGICSRNKINSKITRIEDIIEGKYDNLINDYEIVFISAMSVDKTAVERGLNKLRKENVNCQIILGGPILSDPEFLFTHKIPIGVAGQGEWVLDDLIKNDFSISSFLEDKDKDEYFWVQEKDSFFIEQKRFSATDSADIFNEFHPSIDHITDYPDYWFSKVYVEVVRGCSNHYRGETVRELGGCSDCGNCDSLDDITRGECPEDIPPGCGFCSVSAVFGAPVSRTLKMVSDEIEALLEKGARRIILSAPGFLDYYRDSNNKPIFSPTYPPANVKKIGELLSNLAGVRDKQEHKCSISIENIKPSLVTKEVAEIIGKYLPDTALSIGCETFDENLSNRIGRPSHPRKAIEAAKMFTDNGINSQIYLIHSLPGETVQALEITKKVIEEELHDIAEKITVYRYLPLPKSPFSKTGATISHERYLMKIKREELIEAIIKFNRIKKIGMKGKILEAIVAEKDRLRDKTYICYPLYSGPTISIESEENLLGRVAKVEISAMLSDKLVKGKIVEIIE